MLVGSLCTAYVTGANDSRRLVFPSRAVQFGPSTNVIAPLSCPILGIRLTAHSSLRCITRDCCGTAP